MRRLLVTPRDDWRKTAERFGFDFHTLYGQPYWIEDACYVFSLRQVEDHLERPTVELMAMCYDFVDRAVGDEEILRSLRIPETWWQPIHDSWKRGDKDLYARFDLSYDGRGPAKMLEVNADTPTSLYETALFQWVWLEEAIERDLIPRGADQYNSVQEQLIAAFETFRQDLDQGRKILHLTSVADHPEDRCTVLYMEDCARQAGIATQVLDIEAIGVDAMGRLTDLEDRVIEALFKLYPWEFLIAEEFGVHLQGPLAPQMIEPCWKMVLSNKGLLPWLWRLHRGHDNLLPACFADEPEAASIVGPRYVIKPLLSREGANVRFVDPSSPWNNTTIPGPYGAEGYVFQTLHTLPVFEDLDGKGNHAVVGSWIVAGQPCGVGMREDDGPVTTNTGRFVPHIIL
ncbi:MAG: glutathionylspermidine synthase family protein [Alphaproteobacteria bacterium]